MRSALAGVFLSTWKGRCPVSGEKESTMVAPSLCATQQEHPASEAVWISSTSIPSCRFPPSHPLWLSLHSQQQSSSQAYYSIPIFQLSASMYTGRHTSQSGTGRAEAQTILCKSHSVLSARDQLFHTPLTASDAPLLSQPILCW